MFQELSWPTYQDLINPGFNEFDYPVIAWIFCVKE